MDRYELYYNYAHSQIQEQNERKQSIEVKARGFITLSIALLGVAGLIAANFTSTTLMMGEVSFSSLIMGLMLASFIWAVASSFRILSVDEWYINPSLEEFQAHIQNPDNTDEQIAEWTVDSMTQAYILNEDIISDKSAKLRRTLIALYLEGIALGMLILTVVWP